MRLKLLFVIDNLVFGGGERVFLQLAAGLRERFEVIVAATPGGKFQKALDELGIRFCPVDMSRRLSLKPIRKIKDILLNERIDLLHSQGTRADFFSRIAGKMVGNLHIICTVAMPVEGFNLGLLRKKIYRFMDQISERYVERFLVVSDSLKKTLTEERGISTQRVVRVYNGVELDQYRPGAEEANLRNRWNIPKETPLVGAIGRMVWQKGFKFLIEAMPHIVQRTPSAMFLLVGDGPLRPDLENLARELNVYDRVIFTGFRQDIQRLLSTIDILVVPSLLEGFPMITLEAMAMARPVVATEINGIKEQISHEQEGILVPIRKPRNLAEAVSRIIEDDELAAALGRAARKKVETSFSVEQMVRETEKVYLSLKCR